MLARWVTFLVWAGVAASAVAWGLKVFVQPLGAPPQTRVADTAAAARGDLTRLLGVDAPAPVAVATKSPEPAADARFKLVGVVSPRSAQAAHEGLALIAVDGKPPRAYRVGAEIEARHVLQSVNPRGALLGPRDGDATVALKLPPPTPAATGQLPSAAARAAAPSLAAFPVRMRAPAPAPAAPAAPPPEPTLPEMDEAVEDEAEPPATAPEDIRAPLR